MVNYTNEQTTPWYNLRDQIITVELGTGITGIGNYSFVSFSKIKEIVIQSKVTYVGDYAFYNSNGIMEITIPSTTNNIGYNAFANCGYLSRIEFENIYDWVAKYDHETDEGYELSGSDLVDQTDAADYLCNVYCEYYWERGMEKSTFEEDVDW